MKQQRALKSSTCKIHINWPFLLVKDATRPCLIKAVFRSFVILINCGQTTIQAFSRFSNSFISKNCAMPPSLPPPHWKLNIWRSISYKLKIHQINGLTSIQTQFKPSIRNEFVQISVNFSYFSFHKMAVVCVRQTTRWNCSWRFGNCRLYIGSGGGAQKDNCENVSNYYL